MPKVTIKSMNSGVLGVTSSLQMKKISRNTNPKNIVRKFYVKCVEPNSKE
jgi:hypothetical protein